MSNIEKIRQEIERRKKVYLTKNGFPKGTFGAIKIETYEGLLAFIDSLPEEDLYAEVGDTEEDYIKRSMAKVNECRKMICKDSLQVPETCKENADSFTEDLEKAASRGGFDYVDEIEAKAPGLPWNDHDVEFGYRDGFIAGSNWQKEQIMKEAVEGEIGYWNQRGLSIRLDKSLERLGYDMDTKVKIIIIKGND